MVFENHTAGESAVGEEARAHIASIFETWPDIGFWTRRLYVREGLVVQEWTASATHANTMRRGDLLAEPTGKRVEWDGLDVIPFEDGLVSARTSTQTASRSCARWGCWTRRVALVAYGSTKATRPLPQRLQSGSKAFLARTLPLPPA
jgi:SnoaL-like domain